MYFSCYYKSYPQQPQPLLYLFIFHIFSQFVMFTVFLKNRFIFSSSIFVVTSSEKQQQFQLINNRNLLNSFNSTAVALEDNNSGNTSRRVFPMDEAYFLRKFEEYEGSDCWDTIFHVCFFFNK